MLRMSHIGHLDDVTHKIQVPDQTKRLSFKSRSSPVTSSSQEPNWVAAALLLLENAASLCLGRRWMPPSRPTVVPRSRRSLFQLLTWRWCELVMSPAPNCQRTHQLLQTPLLFHHHHHRQQLTAVGASLQLTVFCTVLALWSWSWCTKMGNARGVLLESTLEANTCLI
jgi:hypothetical protein